MRQILIRKYLDAEELTADLRMVFAQYSKYVEEQAAPVPFPSLVSPNNLATPSPLAMSNCVKFFGRPGPHMSNCVKFFARPGPHPSSRVKLFGRPGPLRWKHVKFLPLRGALSNFGGRCQILVGVSNFRRAPGPYYPAPPGGRRRVERGRGVVSHTSVQVFGQSIVALRLVNGECSIVSCSLGVGPCGRCQRRCHPRPVKFHVRYDSDYRFFYTTCPPGTTTSLQLAHRITIATNRTHTIQPSTVVDINRLASILIRSASHAP